MNRLGIYFFYDEDGIVDDYVPYFLQNLKPFCKELCVVVNGNLTEKSKEKLVKNCDKLIIRKNEGYDSWAYKAVIEDYGYTKIKNYDELLLCNFTFFGPIYPLSELFSKMDATECDFWGVHRHPEIDAYVANTKIIEHIQSHFMVFRNKILQSSKFKEYWETLKPVNSYAEAIANHELRCTQYFIDAGFRAFSYIDLKKYEKRVYNSSIQMANVQAREDRCPLVKRKAFFVEYNAYLCCCNGHQPRELIEFIDKETDYDVSMIWSNLLRTQQGSVLKNNIHLNYILPFDCRQSNETPKASIALILYTYYEDMIDYCFKYAQSMPSYSDVYIITTNKRAEAAAKKVFAKLNVSKVEYLQQNNRGRDVSALLVTAKDIIPRYDYICFAHDKKSSHLNMRITGEDFCRHCFEGVLKSPDYVANVIDTFENNPHLGFLTPPPPVFENFYYIVGQEWGGNYEIAKNILKTRLNIKVKLEDQPIAAFGTMFWFRSGAFKTLLAGNWKYTDFPTEPISVDGTVLHALERIYPLLVQADGYVSGWIMPADFAAVYTGNLFYMLRNINLRLFGLYGYQEFQNMLNILDIKKEGSSEYNFFDIFNKEIKYLKYKILSKITWGQTRKKYKQKRKNLKNKFKHLKLAW